MKKIANISIKNKIEELKEHVEIEINDKGEYIYLEESGTKVIFNPQSRILIRNNKELYMKYSFDLKKTSEGIIKVKELEKSMKVTIKTRSFKITKNKIEIHYELEDEEYTYKIEME